MSRHRTASRSAFSVLDLLIIVFILGVLLALLLPAVQAAREAARRINCNNQLKMLGIAVHNYATSNKVFPPGVICSAANVKAEAADPWADAKLTTKGAHGTSWILRILPYMEEDVKDWDFEFGVSNKTNLAIASKEIRALYCPTRRRCVRTDVDTPMMLSPTCGGTDYGGCVGRHQGFLADADQSIMLPNKDDKLTLCFVPGVDVADQAYKVAGDVSGANATCEAKRGFGIFGRVNASTRFTDVRDGFSNTLMTGELQRITQKTADGPFNANSGPVLSHDGWAIGGSPTLFTTGCPYPADAKTKRLMNNGYFASPGSDHANGANFGLGDGSVRFIATTINSNIFDLMGSMDDRVPIAIDD